MRVKGIVSYKGTRYYGYQVQPHDFEISIQQEIEKALSTIFNQTMKITSAGRTDKGVHAEGQCFHFDCSDDTDVSKVRYSLNRLLPSDIYIRSLDKVSDDFHSRFSAVSKTYRYKINIGEYNPLIDDIVYSYKFKKLDVKKMEEASKIFIGEHNFMNYSSNDEDFVRTIESIKFSQDDDIVIIDIKGNGFRRYMVRMIVGTLIEIGQDRYSVEEAKSLLDTDKFNRTRFKAPAQGLYLYKIDYGGNDHD
jgi:tRNA pseudouridine38-40 synthase